MGWAHTLLHDTQPLSMGRGKQGCAKAARSPQRCTFFVAWALHCWLRTCPAVGLSVAGHRIRAAQYADSCVALLGACTKDTMLSLRPAMSTFTLATGQRLNLGKSCILPLGKPPHPLPTSLCDMPVRPRTRALGIKFSPAVLFVWFYCLLLLSLVI